MKHNTVEIQDLRVLLVKTDITLLYQAVDRGKGKRRFV